MSEKETVSPGLSSPGLKATKRWSIDVGGLVAVGFIFWITLGSSWFFEGKAQICSYSGRVAAKPGSPCYRAPPPSCVNSSSYTRDSAISILSRSPSCITEDYPEGVRREHRLRDSGAIAWAFDRLEDALVPLWNDFFLIEQNRNAVFAALSAVALFVLGKLGNDVWDYFKEQYTSEK